MALKKDYYSRKALSNSGLKKLLRSPEHFQHWLRAERKMSKAMILGELMHYFLLTPELVEDEVAIFKAGKTLDSKAGAKFILDHRNQFVCTEEQYETALAASNKVLKDKKVCRLLGLPDATREHEIVLEYKGIQCKALLDLITPNIILDVKTHTEDGSYFNGSESFDQKFWNLGYDIQGAWYQKMAELHDGVRRDVIYLVIEMEEPHGVTVRGIEQENLDDAWEQCEKAIEIYRECLETNKWPGYGFDLQYVEKPRWRKQKAQNV